MGPVYRQKVVGEDQERVFYTVPPAQFSLWAVSGSSELPPMQVRVDNLRIVPNQITEGQSVTVEAEVVNNGTTTARHNVVLWLNRRVHISRLVTVLSGDSQTVSFAFKPQAGSYEVRVDRLLDSMYVRPGSIDLGPELTTETITLTNLAVDGGTVAYTVNTDRPWLTASPVSFELEPGSSLDVTFSVDRAGLQDDAYAGAATVSFTGARLGSFVVDVTMDVESPASNTEDRPSFPTLIAIVGISLALVGVFSAAGFFVVKRRYFAQRQIARPWCLAALSLIPGVRLRRRG